MPRLSSGVWLSDQPLDANEGASGDTLLRVVLRLNRRALDKYELREERKAYREWQIPAAVVNAQLVSMTIIPYWREDLWDDVRQRRRQPLLMRPLSETQARLLGADWNRLTPL